MSHGPSTPHDNRRRHARHSVSAMYSAVEAKPLTPRRAADPSDPTEPLAEFIAGAPISGHIYDVSLGGARLELDGDVRAGDVMHLSLHLPAERSPVDVDAVVVRVFDRDDDPGSRRVAVRFEAFTAPADEHRLRRYLDEPPRAAVPAGRVAA